jgi:hypothetical protein
MRSPECAGVVFADLTMHCFMVAIFVSGKCALYNREALREGRLMTEVAYLDPFALANGHMSEIIYYELDDLLLAHRSALAALSGAANQPLVKQRRPRRPSPLVVEKRLDGWPKYLTARDLAGPVFPVSEAVILDAAREHGLGRRLGRAIIFTPEDCQRLYEEKSSAAPKAPTGSSGGLSPDAALKKALKLATERSPISGGPNARQSFSKRASTVVALRPRSPRRP